MQGFFCCDGLWCDFRVYGRGMECIYEECGWKGVPEEAANEASEWG